jgi:hypothetical protein
MGGDDRSQRVINFDDSGVAISKIQKECAF